MAPKESTFNCIQCDAVIPTNYRQMTYAFEKQDLYTEQCKTCGRLHRISVARGYRGEIELWIQLKSNIIR